VSNARATGQQPDPARRSRRSPELAEPLDFDVAVVAEVESLPELRRSLARWLAPQGLSEGDLGSVQVVMSELVANAIEASDPRDPVEVRVRMLRNSISVEVRNRSHRDHPVPIPSMADPLAPRGRGLAIVGTLTKDLSLREIDGYTVAIGTLRLAPAAKPR
jgi:anti-sigma regulatory factor (Ser/Thr protein kinase)